MTMEQPLYYREESPESGATLVVDALRRERDSFRVHLRVLNTGEQGRLNLRFEVNYAYVMDETHAQEWRDAYPLAYAMGRVGADLDARSYSGVMLVPTAGTILPASIDKGEEWDGWFETVRTPLPLGAAAMIMVFGPLSSQTKLEGTVRRLLSPTRPFVSLREDVTVTPLSGSDLLMLRWQDTARSYLNDLMQLDTLLAIPGALLGVLIGSQISFAAAIIGVFPGVILGSMAGRLIRWYRGSRGR